MNKRILFEISHPKHFHQFKYLIHDLEDGNDVKIIARDKDVVLKLLDENGYDYEIFGQHGKTMIQKYLVLPSIIARYFSIVRKFKPDLIVSRSSPYAAMVSRILPAKALVLPDSEVVTFNNRFVVPLSDYIITPRTYNLDHGANHYKVNGFFENAYLHPKYFHQNNSILSDLGVKEGDPFFLIRLVGWFANHDSGRYGFSEEQKVKLVKHLNTKGKVFISGEGTLSEELKPYQINIKASKIHSLIYHASMYIGDSQTMATEAALLGTPSIRYNSFVGENDMSNFKILENEYGLLTNASTFDEVMKATDRIIKKGNIKEDFAERKARYFADTGDVNKETLAIISEILGT